MESQIGRLSLAYKAMMFAREVHCNQKRKYTNNPYVDHLAEVAGIVATASLNPISITVSWLHDCMEDKGVTFRQLDELFGANVAEAVVYLSDREQGNRATRKAATRQRLSQAEGWIQTIKVADIISNTSSIVEHDPKFACLYLEEISLLLDVMGGADQRLVAIARSQIRSGNSLLSCEAVEK